MRLGDLFGPRGESFCRGLALARQDGPPIELEFELEPTDDYEGLRIDENWRGDGLLVFRCNRLEAKNWKAASVPVVNLSRENHQDGVDFPVLTFDNQQIGRVAARHLLGLGLENFAAWHDPSLVYSRERIGGFVDEIRAAGFETRLIEIVARQYRASERMRRVALLSDPQLLECPTPCGLFAKHDFSALAALRALRRIGRSCPGEIALVGVDNDYRLCASSNPPLSSVELPIVEFGRQALLWLLELIEGGRSDLGEVRRLAPLSLVARESTRFVRRLDDPHADGLLWLDRELSHRLVSVSELAKRLGLSGAQLRQYCGSAFGRSPKQEIDLRRARAVFEALRASEQPVGDLAHRMGFRDSGELRRFFQRLTGRKPSEVRKLESRNLDFMI